MSKYCIRSFPCMIFGKEIHFGVTLDHLGRRSSAFEGTVEAAYYDHFGSRAF
jgi:hypothetical protein